MFKERYKSHHSSNANLDKAIPKIKSNKMEFLESLEKDRNKESKVLYIHIPFCDKICSFCNLNRKQQDNDLEDYTNYLLEELKFYANTNYVKNNLFEAIYFGGGTPTILKENQLRRILYFIKENYPLHPEYEWTLETTIHNLSEEKINLFNEVGVNRLSIGIQTFSESGRKFLNRTFNKETAISKIGRVKEIFKGYVCSDIIYNYENQTIEELIEDAKLIKKLNFDSTSFYSLMIHQGSQLSQRIAEDTTIDRDYQFFSSFYNELINDEKWELMELTKFVRKGRDKYKYIGLRNTGHDTLAIGVGAGGNASGFIHFSMNEKMGMFLKEEMIHAKYRKLGGLFQFKTYNTLRIKEHLGIDEFEEYMKILEKFQEEGLGQLGDRGFELSPKGVFWGNNMSKYISDRLIEKELNNV